MSSPPLEQMENGVVEKHLRQPRELMTISFASTLLSVSV